MQTFSTTSYLNCNKNLLIESKKSISEISLITESFFLDLAETFTLTESKNQSRLMSELEHKLYRTCLFLSEKDQRELLQSILDHSTLLSANILEDSLLTEGFLSALSDIANGVVNMGGKTARAIDDLGVGKAAALPTTLLKGLVKGAGATVGAVKKRGRGHGRGC